MWLDTAMTTDAALTIIVLLLTLVALTRELLPPPVTIVGAVVLLLLLGVVTPAEAFSGFSNPAPITVAALYVLARAVEKTGALQPLVHAMLGRGRSRRGALLRLVFPTAAASAFLNNTPIVAMLLPQVSEWAERRAQSPSRYLMPLSFAAILGGVATTIGTSTNLVVSGLLEASGDAPLGLFEISAVGAPVALAGLAALVLLSPWLLPDRRPAHREIDDNLREFVVNMLVEPRGPMDGQTVEDAGLRNLQGVFLVEIERDGALIAPVTPATTLRGGDRLIFVGKADLVLDLQTMRGLALAVREHTGGLDTARHTFFEAVVGQISPLVGRTLKEVSFRGRYQAAVVAIHRAGHRVKAKLGDVRLRVGDTLLILAGPDFRTRYRDRNDFLLVSMLGGTPPVTTGRAWIVFGVAVGIVAGAALGVLPILHLSLLGAIVLVVTGVLTPWEARRSVDVDVIVVIAGAFGLGAAMASSGVAAALAGGLVDTLGTFGPTGALLGLVLATIALTSLITNNAGVILMYPITVAVATRLDVDVRPFAMAIAVAASASFLTPIGYQTNLMVYGPGGYRFSDYVRLGGVVTLLVVPTILLAVHLS
jgi:di/tricarboxylate transporter